MLFDCTIAMTPANGPDRPDPYAARVFPSLARPLAFLRLPVLMFGLLLGLALIAPHQAQAVALHKAATFYARDMEFYYQNPRPEVLPGILRSFDRLGALGQGEKRLMTAAFMAEALRRDPTNRQRILPPAVNADASRDVRRTLAWAVHLAQLPDAAALLDVLLTDEANPTLRRQILGSPAPLQAWDIYTEKSVLQMYWAGFMASGDMLYLDSIINAALTYARLNAVGRQKEESFAMGAAAAASLYELAPRHEAVRARLEARLRSLSAAEAETLRVILRQNPAR